MEAGASRLAQRAIAGTACVAGVLALALPTAGGARVKEPTSTGSGGAAASVDELATRTAVETLREGGNAVDAAVASASVLGVTEPFSAGIGGGGFMLIRTPEGKVKTIDGRETAPAAMTPESFLDEGEPLGFNRARYSGLSAGVPGTVATWDKAIKRYGTISLAKALRPGIAVARGGFRIDRTFFDQIAENLDWFDDIPSTAELYLNKNGNPRSVGSTLRNRDLADAYERIGDLGAERGFYRGVIARAMAEAAQDPPIADGADHPWLAGLLTRNDIHSYAALWRPPTKISYRGQEVWGMGPPSSGGSTVGEVLNILEGYNLGGGTRARMYHRFLEASRYAYADRGAYLADPAFFDVPLAGLLSDSYAAERRNLITNQAADAAPVDPGDPTDNGGPGARATVDREGKSTTHLTVVDEEGMVVSYTFTIESTGGNGIVVPGWGFLLNNELTDFTYDDPEAANAPDGGKRPRSSMSPTLVTRDGEPQLALGSPGGSTIITTVLQVLIERLDRDTALPDAIARPRASQQNLETTLAEPAFIGSPLADTLTDEFGHEFSEADPPEIGAVAAVEFLGGGELLAAAEPERRGGGSAKVVNPGD